MLLTFQIVCKQGDRSPIVEVILTITIIDSRKTLWNFISFLKDFRIIINDRSLQILKLTGRNNIEQISRTDRLVKLLALNDLARQEPVSEVARKPRYRYTRVLVPTCHVYAEQRGRTNIETAFIIGISISVTFDQSGNTNEVWSRD